jgi:hypothetical protein
LHRDGGREGSLNRAPAEIRVQRQRLPAPHLLKQLDVTVQFGGALGTIHGVIRQRVIVRQRPTPIQHLVNSRFKFAAVHRR